MGELETTVAAPFIHMRAPSLPQMKLIFYFTQDKHWMGIDDAKNLINRALSLGLYAKNERGELVPSEALKSEKIPLGFRPTERIFVVEREDPIEGVLHTVSAKTGKDPKTLAAELPELKKRFDGLIHDEAALILLAKKYRVDISRYQPELLKLIEK